MHVYLQANDVRKTGKARICIFSEFPLPGIQKHVRACCRKSI